ARAEQPLEPGVRPAPVVLRRRVVDLDAVRGGEHPATGGEHTAQLAHRPLRVDRVLEHLGAEDDVEARVRDGELLDRAVQVGRRVRRLVHADVLARGAPKEWVVGLHAAADVEDAVAAVALARAARFLPKPGRKRGAEQEGRRATRWVSPQLAWPFPSGPLVHRADITPSYDGCSWTPAARSSPELPARTAPCSPSSCSSRGTRSSESSGARPRSTSRTSRASATGSSSSRPTCSTNCRSSTR